jgi:dTDP-L-rhamnose 4-epimerase
MRVLLTGGAGFIGSHLADALAERGHEVVVVDRLHPRAHAAPPDYLREDVEYLRGGLDAATLDAALAGIDAVCHQAAMVGLGRGLVDAGDYVRENDLGTAELLAAIHRRPTGDRPGRLVLASSMVVYGEGAYRCDRHGAVRPGPRERARLERGQFEPTCPRCGGELAAVPIGEDAPPDPRNVYAATKLHQEHLAQASMREGGPVVTALRYHNVYGPRMPADTPYSGVAAIFRSALAGGQAPRVLEDGAQRRDFVHVRDVATANLLALLAPEPVPGVFNVASGEPRTIGELAAALAASSGGPAPEVVGGWRAGDVRHVVASPALAAERLGFRAEVSFAAGMAELATAPLRAPVATAAAAVAHHR